MQDTVIVNGCIAEAPLIADPGLVHGVILARFEAIHMPVMVMDVDVTTTRTSRTDRCGLLQKPDTNLEAKILAGQGANRTNIDGISGVRIIEPFARKSGNLCRITTLENAQLVRLRDLVAETHTACAQDTT